MKTPQSVKNEKIAALEDCLYHLLLKDNGHNSKEIEFLYNYIYTVMIEMEQLEAMNSLDYFRKNMNSDIRKSLFQYNIKIK